MNENLINKFILYSIGVIIAYFILRAIEPYLCLGIIGLIVYRIYLGERK